MKVVLFETKNTFPGINEWNKHAIGKVFIYLFMVHLMTLRKYNAE
jgi:hypothetical protein